MLQFYSFQNTRFNRPSGLLTLLCCLLALVGTALPAQAGSGFFNDYIIVSGNGGQTYYRANAGFNEAFQGADLGAYDRTTGTLMLNGGQAHTFENSGDAISADSTFLYFRLYRQTAANGAAGPGFSFQRILLPQTSLDGNGDRTFETTNGTITRSNSTAMTVNLVSLTSGPGTYVVEAYFRASGVNNGTNFRIFDSNGGSNYKATFTVTGAALGQAASTWLGGRNPGCDGPGGMPTQTTSLLLVPSNWFDPFNWTNGVPTQVTDVEVPNYNTNQCVVYPNINGTALTGPASTHDLALRGNNGGDRSIMRLVTGSLKMHGNMVNPADSYIQRSGTDFILAGTGNQTFDGAQFFNVTIDGGGRKLMKDVMRVTGTLTMTNGILVTGTANPVNTNVTLVSGGGAKIEGESENSYIEGVVIANEVAAPGIYQAFGNIGLDLTFTSGDPGLTEVTRTTGISAADLLSGKPGIKRYYGIRPANANNASNMLVARFGFRYLDSETRSVRNNLAPMTQDLTETQLTIWYSTSGGSGFFNAGRDRIDNFRNRVTQNGINTFATTTLGENGAPLPVNFLYFTAGRTSKGALLNWGSALEHNNAGFDVQMSTDGREFTTLTTVRPASANSTTARHYSYTDANALAGTRYYRLRQVDLDGKYAYTPVRVVSFAGTGNSLEISASSVFPNPFHEGEQLLVNVLSAVAGKATLRLTDALGREVLNQTTEVPAGHSTVALPSLNAKPTGVYLVRLTLPGGATQTIKVQKQ